MQTQSKEKFKKRKEKKTKHSFKKSLQYKQYTVIQFTLGFIAAKNQNKEKKTINHSRKIKIYKHTYIHTS